jgi:hypothetical protein
MLQTWPIADSHHKLPSLVHGGAQQAALSGSSVSRRKTTNRDTARGQHDLTCALVFRKTTQNQ